MEQRRRIRDFSYDGERWIAALVTEEGEPVWRGRVRFFLDGPGPVEAVEDALAFEGYTADSLVAQASALSVDEFRVRLERGRKAPR